MAIMNQISFESEIANARAKLESDLESLVQLRPLPAIAMQIMKVCDEPKTKVGELVRLIECDAAISSRILSVVNSSTYGYSREVTSINQAVVVLGFKSLSQLTVSIASEKVFSDGDTAIQPRLELYDHSLATAAVSRLLANQTDFPADPGAAFLAGILHDVGKLVLFDVAPNFYSKLQSSERPDDYIATETAAFGVDHSMIGAQFGSLWGLPCEINSAIEHHHCLDEPCSPTLKVTSLANELTKIWGVGQTQTSSACETTQAWLADLDEPTINTLQEQASTQFTELKSLLVS
jgi:putative nucleotidyltransferase with HDIG domain